GRALAKCGRWSEASHCLRDAQDEASANCRTRAERFAAFSRVLDETWSAAFRVGFADGGAERVITAALPDLCGKIGASSAGELYAPLRDDYGVYLILLSSDPLNLDSEATEIVHVDAAKGPAAWKIDGVRRIVTGAPRFRMAWALSPLTPAAR